ncbi:hypothetical protein HQ563_14630 [bacterium]|nr:hypothetical protein [bacterium]
MINGVWLYIRGRIRMKPLIEKPGSGEVVGLPYAEKRPIGSVEAARGMPRKYSRTRLLYLRYVCWSENGASLTGQQDISSAQTRHRAYEIVISPPPGGNGAGAHSAGPIPV